MTLSDSKIFNNMEHRAASFRQLLIVASVLLPVLNFCTRIINNILVSPVFIKSAFEAV